MYRLKANTSAKRGPATGEAKMIGFEHESPERAEPQLATCGTVHVVRNGTGAPSFFGHGVVPVNTIPPNTEKWLRKLYMKTMDTVKSYENEVE